MDGYDYRADSLPAEKKGGGQLAPKQPKRAKEKPKPSRKK
jgi:hypothetical protein